MKMFEWFIKKRPDRWDHIPSLAQLGWGNGYIKIPKDHWLAGVDGYDVERMMKVPAHGGFACCEWDEGYWILGFDTAHHYSKGYTESKVKAETIRVATELYHLEQPEVNDEECEKNSFDHCEVCGKVEAACYC